MKTRTPSTIITKKHEKYLEDLAQQGLPEGFGGTHIEELVPKPNYTDVETKRLRSGYNSFITLGKDRNAGRYSGCGGVGETQCGAIDLVVGRMGSIYLQDPEKFLKEFPDGGPAYVDNNFFADSARVYITQKAMNIDEYLGFDNITHDPRDLSSVVIKSDCTRIVGRESVRIYTGAAKTALGFNKIEGELRSNATPIESPRIELIGGGNDTDLQPAILGDNLIDFIRENNRIIIENVRTVITDILLQLTEHGAMLSGLSLGLYGARATANGVQNINNMVSLLTDAINEMVNNVNYLDKGLIPGKKSILSRRVFIT